MTDARSFAAVLDDAVERRGLSLARLRHHLRRRGHDVSVATLSYWRRGLSRPRRAASFAALPTLEDILRLPPGALTDTLRERAAPEDNGGPEVARLTAEGLDLAWPGTIVTRSVHDRIVLDDGGRVSTHAVRSVVEATEDGTDRFPAAFRLDEGQADLRIESRASCEIGRTVRTPSTVVAEVLLPRALARGEAWMTEVTYHIHGDPEVVTHWGRRLTTTARVVRFDVTFTGPRLPMNARAVSSVGGVTTTRPLVFRGPTFGVQAEDFGPGDLDVCWNW